MRQAKLKFGTSANQPGLFLTRRALVILTLALASSSAAYAAKPVTVQPKNAPGLKKVQVAGIDQVAHGKKLFERLTCAGCHPNGDNTLHPYRATQRSGIFGTL